MKSIKKNQFADLNDKTYYFHDGILSLPSGHFLLTKVREEKEKYQTNLRTTIKEKMYKFLELESSAVQLCERLRILGSIYAQAPLLYVLNSQLVLQIKSLKSTRELIINGSWK